MELFLNFFSAFDSRTAALIVVIAFSIQAIAIGAQAFLIREYKGVWTTLLGNLSLAIGYALLLFRDIFPDFLTIVVANTLIVTSPSLYYIAMTKFMGQRFNKVLVFSIIAATAILLIYFRYVTNNIFTRLIIVTLSAVYFLFTIAYKAWKMRYVPYRFSLGLAVTPLMVHGIMLIVRAVTAIISPPKVLFTNSPVEFVTYLLLFIVGFFWTIGFILMVSQRLQIDLVELAKTSNRLGRTGKY
jgi:hypothetical protein